jgi:hypothetical protein
VQVVSVTLRQLEMAGQPKKKLTAERYLVLRVRAHQPAGSAEFIANSLGERGSGRERPRPSLTDLSGRTYAPASVGDEAGEQTQNSSVFPLGITDEVYVFDPPPPSTALKLEVPAETFGGSGTLRFTIPASIIRTDLDPEAAKKGKL